MKIPQILTNGDQVAIVATARKVKKEELQPVINLLKTWGLTAVIGSSIGLEENQFAGHDKERAEDFQRQLNDPNIKAIWCAKGGYGTVRILDQLDFTAFLKNPKWIIGYSDITALHSHIHNIGISTLHAQICINIENKSNLTRETLRKNLFGEAVDYTFSHHKLNRNGIGEGQIIEMFFMKMFVIQTFIIRIF